MGAMTTTADRAPAPPDRGCVACIGVFDGVHRGHQALLALARLRSRAAGLPLGWASSACRAATARTSSRREGR